MLRTNLGIVQGRTIAAGYITAHPFLNPISSFGNRSPVQIIRDSMAKCPDEIPIQGTADLPFLHNVALRDALRIEISTVEQALSNREWKAATVLGGAALEGILFWTIKGMHNELVTLQDKPKEPIEQWSFGGSLMWHANLG